MNLNFSFCFHLLRQVDLVSLFVLEYILKETQLLAWDDAETETILQLPSAEHGDEPLVDVGGYVRVNVQLETFCVECVDQIVNLVLKRVGEEER